MSPWSAFYRRRIAAPVDWPAGIQVEHTVAPVEPPASTDERVAEVDRKLAAIAAIPPPERTPEQWRTLDRLIDLRQAIRPAPPLPEDAS
jgi:hypothetical protein